MLVAENITKSMGKKTQCKFPRTGLNHFFLLMLSLLPALPISQSFVYGEALSKSLLYFEAQRSGRLPYNQRVLWRQHSGLTDGLEQGVDLVGGYYDAGDNVKFGLPMAFTVTLLSWGVIEFREEIAAAGELRHALEAIKWGTDYFIKAHTHPHVLWAQVGDGDTDHLCWQRPEDMTTSRRAFKVDEENPGSDVAAETAAAMAAASIVFRRTNPHYSHLLLEHAQQLFEFSEKYRGNYDKSIKGAKGYYASVSGYMDELLWAAFWLYRATDNNKNYYFNFAIQNAYSLGGITWALTEFSWDVKYAGLQILASMIPTEDKSEDQKQILKQYTSKSEHYLCACLNANNATNVRRTPGGLMYTRRWNNMQYVSTALLSLTIVSHHLQSTNQTLNCPTGSFSPDKILSFVRSQAGYILGSNPMGLSYLVGYGYAYPKRVHHRGASMELQKGKTGGFLGCKQGYDNWYGRHDPNPNVLVGALVGGPDSEDEYRDRRGNFMQTEACTYNSAPLVGVFAKLYSLERTSSTTGSISSGGNVYTA
ncbi:endoglucanase 11-like [Primulina eburnea]|uniref:endoglucanase 11-like n=1 Tax=Primulina eburnea TaxID=1245227 RepID=UPI003C6BE528